MDFCLSDDQRDLQIGIRSFLDGRFPLDRVADQESAADVIDPQVWTEIAQMGVFSLAQDGLDARAAVLIFEELGRSLIPGPLVATYLGSNLIDGALEGNKIVGLFEPDQHFAIVEHGGQVDELLWFRGNDLCSVNPSTLDLVPAKRPLDALSPISHTRITDPIADVLVSGEAVQIAYHTGALLTAAMAVGVGDAATKAATEYAKGREQFGRPIGSFQAVKHLLAEMLVKVEVARAAVHAGACSLSGQSSDEIARSVSAAKVMSSDAALFCGKTGIQVHGGMGFTWEVHAQRYWKRAVVLDATFGTGDRHAEFIANTLIRG